LAGWLAGCAGWLAWLAGWLAGWLMFTHEGAPQSVLSISSSTSICWMSVVRVIHELSRATH